MKEKNEKAIFLSILCVSFLGVQMIKSYEYGILDFFSYVFFPTSKWALLILNNHGQVKCSVNL